MAAEAPGRPRRAARDARLWLWRLARLGRWFGAHVFSSLARRILIINLAGLLALLLGILFLNQFRAGLTDARVQSLLVQGEIIAAAVAGSAAVDDGSIRLAPEDLAQMEPGDPNDFFSRSFEFRLNPEQIAPVLRRLLAPVRVRARVYDREGVLVIDSRFLFATARPGEPDPAAPDLLTRAWQRLRAFMGRPDLPRYREHGVTEGRAYPEVAEALTSRPTSIVRVNDRGELIVSVAVPVRRAGELMGALLLSTQGGDIDAIVDAERFAILRVFLVAMAVMIVVSLLMSGSIAGPVRRLADAAERVRRGTRAREEIPDFTKREDEIGHLSGALRDMTGALYDRIEAIERFAADVAHELKNPLTSLRSAIETLPLVKREEDRERLLAIIRHDVRRLDRLISDISDASRLDAELQREQAVTLDLARTLAAVVGVQNDIRRPGEPAVRLTVHPHPSGARAFRVEGHEVRLGQVIANLLDNARSFSPPGRDIRVALRREGGFVEVEVEDDGPGIKAEPVERIFERFYTDRPETAFGNNSGLGLSISKQIVEAHGGTIVADNRLGPPGSGVGPSPETAELAGSAPAPVLGARFRVRLPAA